MIRLKNKIAYAVAIATMASMIPVTGAHAATNRLETKEGTINSAVALSDGKYVYNGYKNDDQETGLYYSSKGKDKEIEDTDIVGKYGKKYVVLNEDTDNLLDTSTGKILEDEDFESSEENVKDAIYKKLRKIDSLDITSREDIEITKVGNGDRFEDNVYRFEVGSIIGLVNSNGNYEVLNLDTDISVYDASTNKLVKLKSFGSNNSGVEANLASFELLAQTSDKYYILSKVSTNLGDTNYIQVVSKASSAGADDDDFQVPNSVTSYLVSNNVYSGDRPDIDSILEEGTEFTVIKDKLCYYKIAEGKLEVGNVTLKQASVTLAEGANKVQTKYALVDDVDSIGLTEDELYSVDTNGVIWAISESKIFKYESEEFEEVYRVGSGYTGLDVYDANNLIAWTDDSYVTNFEEKKVEEEKPVVDTTEKEETPQVKPEVQPEAIHPNGWVKTEYGDWNYYSNNTKATGWVKDGGKWYCLNEKGNMQTGWVKDRDNWYYLNNSGVMQTGWVQDIIGSIVLNGNGKDTWYHLDNSGVMQTGWFKDTDGSWYYLNNNGTMASNTTIGGYKLASNGKWIR